MVPRGFCNGRSSNRGVHLVHRGVNSLGIRDERRRRPAWNTLDNIIFGTRTTRFRGSRGFRTFFFRPGWQQQRAAHNGLQQTHNTHKTHVRTSYVYYVPSTMDLAAAGPRRPSWERPVIGRTRGRALDPRRISKAYNIVEHTFSRAGMPSGQRRYVSGVSIINSKRQNIGYPSVYRHQYTPLYKRLGMFYTPIRHARSLRRTITIGSSNRITIISVDLHTYTHIQRPISQRRPISRRRSSSSGFCRVDELNPIQM